MLENRKLTVAAAFAAAMLLTGTGTYAQEDSGASQQQTRRTPTMREKVYQPLSEAQACAENDDMQCAQRLLDRVRAMTDLTPYELAQMWNFYAFIYFNQENYPEAIRAYEQVLQQPDLPEGIQTQTMFALAQLYTQQEDYQKALDMLNRWFQVAQNPNPESYVLKAQIHYQLQQYREGIEPIQTAMRLAQERGAEPQEGWYQLLNVLYFELEDYPNVIRTLTTLAERWTKKDYLVQLAGIYGQEGQEQNQLALYEAAHAAGLLDRGTELVSLAQMLIQADIPYKAARILDEGMKAGTIEATESNLRLLGQAWQLAQHDREAVETFSRAAQLTRDGELDFRVAQSYMNLARWEECATAAREALRKGGLNRPDQVNLVLGGCLIERKQYDDARQAFQAAARDERSAGTARQWLAYIDAEVAREREIAAAMRRN